MRQILIVVLASLAALIGGRGANSPHAIAASVPTLVPNVRAAIQSAGSDDVAGPEVPQGDPLQVSASISGSGPLPIGTAAIDAYDTLDCSGPSSSAQDVLLVGGSVPVAHSLQISNNGGWDSATTWTSQGGDGFDTNWSGSLFMGTDPPFFSHSGAGWRFTGLPISAGDTIDDAYLLLRIQKSRPSLASETFGTWQTAVRTDVASGASFAGLDHDGFVERFGAGGVTWEVPFSFAQPDSFGTQNGTNYARSPDISTLVAERTNKASWATGGDIVLGVLDDTSLPTAEAQVIDAADNVRLHIDWTVHEPVAQAASAPLLPVLGVHSYQVHYSGDATYAATDSACLAITVTAPDSDGDGYSDVSEEAIGKDPLTYCSIMRADVDGDHTVTVLDIALVGAHFGQATPPAPSRLRQGAGSTISILDLATMATVFRQNVAACA
jgi:hypothetical protein